MIRTLFTCTLFFLGMHVSSGQIDSLWNIYLGESDDTKARGIFMKIQGQCKKDFFCYRPVTEYLKTRPMDAVKSRTYSFFCSALQSSFLFEECIQYGKKAMAEFAGQNPDPAWPYLISNSLAISYGHVSKVDSALYFAEKSEIYTRQPELAKYAWRPDYARFNAYEVIKKRDLSYQYLEKSYSYLKNSSDRMSKGFVLFELLRISDIRQKSNDFDRYLKEYVQFTKEGNKKPDDIHANLLLLFKNDREAIQMLEDKLKKIESDTTTTLVVNPVTEKMKLIGLYTRTGDHDKAIKRLREILKDSASTSDAVIHNAYIGLIENFELSKQWDSAYVYAKKYYQFQNSRYSKNLADQIASFEVKYQTQQKENEIQKQKAALAENKLKLRTAYGILAGTGIAGLLLILFLTNRSKQQKMIMAKEQEIQRQKIIQLEQDNKLLSLNALIEGQELERSRIAQDLHDGLGGLLTTVKAHFNVIRKEMEQIEKLNVYDKTNRLIDEACTEVRRIAHDMVPHSIKITGLTGALEDLKDSIIARGLDCEVDIHGFSNDMLTEQKSNMLYRILQELTTNVVKHANATRIFIQLLAYENELQVVVEDNGKGFDVHQTGSNGLGLKSVRSRVEYLGGQLMIDSSPSHGTTVHIQLHPDHLSA